MIDMLKVGVYEGDDNDGYVHVISRYILDDESSGLDAVFMDLNVVLEKGDLDTVSEDEWNDIETGLKLDDVYISYKKGTNRKYLVFEKIVDVHLQSQLKLNDIPNALLVCHGNLHRDVIEMFIDIIDLTKYQLTYLDHDPESMDLDKCGSKCILGSIHDPNIIEEALNKTHNREGYDLVISIFCPINIWSRKSNHPDKNQRILDMLKIVYSYLKDGGMYISNNFAMIVLQSMGKFSSKKYNIDVSENVGFINDVLSELAIKAGYRSFRFENTSSCHCSFFIK